MNFLPISDFWRAHCQVYIYVFARVHNSDQKGVTALPCRKIVSYFRIFSNHFKLDSWYKPFSSKIHFGIFYCSKRACYCLTRSNIEAHVSRCMCWTPDSYTSWSDPEWSCARDSVTQDHSNRRSLGSGPLVEPFFQLPLLFSLSLSSSMLLLYHYHYYQYFNTIVIIIFIVTVIAMLVNVASMLSRRVGKRCSVMMSTQRNGTKTTSWRRWRNHATTATTMTQLHLTFIPQLECNCHK